VSIKVFVSEGCHCRYCDAVIGWVKVRVIEYAVKEAHGAWWLPRTSNPLGRPL